MTWKTRARFGCLTCLTAILLTAAFSPPALAQPDTLTIATYNLLKFPSSNGAARVDDFRKVLQFMQPDILVVQELESQSALLTLLNNVMNVGPIRYETAPFSDGPDTDSGLFFNSNKVTLLGLNAIPTSVRDIMEYTLLAFDQELTIFSAHLKAGSSARNQQIRANQATLLRNHMNGMLPRSNFILVGDFNMRSSAEQAFVTLTANQADNDGRLFDPINRPGNWNNNSFFIPIHTQSTRVTAFGDGATGGLDDRFDMILVSESLLSGGGVDVLPATYKAFGNDANHFNMAINAGTNLAVPDSIADALHQASDHLPVISGFVFGNATTVAETPSVPGSFRLEQNYPNPFNPTTTIRFFLSKSAKVNLRVLNLKGQEVARLLNDFKQPGEYSVEFEADGLSSGVYVYQLRAGAAQISKKLVLMQ